MEDGAELLLRDMSFRIRDGERDEELFSVEGFSLEPGAQILVRGPSGCGKSTFLKLLAGIVLPSSGSVTWGREEISRMSEEARDRWRGENVGFVFQDFRLFESLSCEENLLLPVTFRREISGGDRTRAAELLRSLEIPAGTAVPLLSRGERQRLAVARVLMQTPKVILADEPTASLDGRRGLGVTELLRERASALGCTLIAVSHDPDVIRRFDRVWRISNGRLEREERR